MRQRRKLCENAWYHVTARSNHQRLLMEPEVVKQMFLDVIARAKKKYSFRLENFVVMGNHFHFLIQPNHEVSLSKIMKWILQTFAIRYNKAHGLWGHFWGDRFFSWIIPNLLEFLRIFAYIDENPVKAGLVVVAEDWKWGALGLRRAGRPRWLDALPPGLRRHFPAHTDQAPLLT